MIKDLLFIPTDIKQTLKDNDIFAAMMDLSGKAFRDVRGRKTMQLNLHGKSYFIKQHFGVGWLEIIKNLISFKLPILGAMTEVRAIQKLNEIGVLTTPLVAYGQRGSNPANIQSFVLTEDLGNIISLEDLCVDWKSNPPSERLKRRLIIEVARIARKLHESGINHRDFYLCHLCLDADFFAKDEIKFYLIDLHRVLIHKTISTNDNMKDIAALYFSSMGIGLTKRDLLRFKMHYLPKGLLENNFWQAVEVRANKLYKKFHSDKFQRRLAAEKSAIR